MTKEYEIENWLIERLKDLKYIHRPDISDRKSLEANFRAKFEALNKVKLTTVGFYACGNPTLNPPYLKPPNCCASGSTSSVRTANPCIIPCSTSRTGAKTITSSSVSCASIPKTASNGTM